MNKSERLRTADWRVLLLALIGLPIGCSTTDQASGLKNSDTGPAIVTPPAVQPAQPIQPIQPNPPPLAEVQTPVRTPAEEAAYQMFLRGSRNAELPPVENETLITKPTVDYTVAKGDTLWDLAQKYKTTVKDIKSVNKLERDLIIEGQKLRIPTEENLPEEPSPPEGTTNAAADPDSAAGTPQ